MKTSRYTQKKKVRVPVPASPPTKKWNISKPTFDLKNWEAMDIPGALHLAWDLGASCVQIAATDRSNLPSNWSLEVFLVSHSLSTNSTSKRWLSLTSKLQEIQLVQQDVGFLNVLWTSNPLTLASSLNKTPPFEPATHPRSACPAEESGPEFHKLWPLEHIHLIPVCMRRSPSLAIWLYSKDILTISWKVNEMV